MKQPAMFALRKQGQPERPPIEELMIAHRLPTPEQEYPFAKQLGRAVRFDYAFTEFKVALEIDGAVFGRYLVIEKGHERRGGQSIPLAPGTVIRAGGRHNSGSAMVADVEKHNLAQVLGWCVIRAVGNQVKDGSAIATLIEALKARGWRGSDGTPLSGL